MRRLQLRLVALAVACLLAGGGCVHGRYKVPAILGASGAVLTVGGTTSLVALADHDTGRVTSLSVMAVGIATLLVGAIWLGIRIRCETPVDCPQGDTCQPVPTASGRAYGVCVRER